MFGVNRFAWAKICDYEFIQIIRVGGTPGIARIITTLLRIMVEIELENSEYESSKPDVSVIKP